MPLKLLNSIQSLPNTETSIEKSAPIVTPLKWAALIRYFVLVVVGRQLLILAVPTMPLFDPFSSGLR